MPSPRKLPTGKPSRLTISSVLSVRPHLAARRYFFWRSPTSGTQVEDCSAIVLAGGRASRLGGVNKARLEVGGSPLLERVLDSVSPLASQLIVVGHLAGDLASGRAEVVPDLFADGGSLGGILTGLIYSKHDLAIVVGCDMPYLSTDLLRLILESSHGWDVTVPRIGPYQEALHAAYRRGCIPVLLDSLESGKRRIVDCYTRVRTREIPEEELRRLDPELRSFVNVNTPEDLERARNG